MKHIQSIRDFKIKQTKNKNIYNTIANKYIYSFFRMLGTFC